MGKASKEKWASASLRIMSRTLSVDEINKALEVEATRSHDKGTPVNPKKPKSRLRPQTLWILESTLSKERPLEHHLEHVVLFCEDNKKALEEVAKDCTIDLFSGFSAGSTHGAMELERLFLKRMSGLPVNFLLELYPPEEPQLILDPEPDPLLETDLPKPVQEALVQTDPQPVEAKSPTPREPAEEHHWPELHLPSRGWMLGISATLLLLGGLWLSAWFPALVYGISPSLAVNRFYEAPLQNPKDLSRLDLLILAGDDSVSMLLEDLQNPNLPRRGDVMTFLGNGKYREAIPTLTAVAINPQESPQIRATALTALYQIDASTARETALGYRQRDDALGISARQIHSRHARPGDRRSYWDAFRALGR